MNALRHFLEIEGFHWRRRTAIWQPKQKSRQRKTDPGSLGRPRQILPLLRPAGFRRRLRLGQKRRTRGGGNPSQSPQPDRILGLLTANKIAGDYGPPIV